MSDQRHKHIRAVREFCRLKNIQVHHESNYPSPPRIARLGGRRRKGTKTRIQDRLANGMLIHLPYVECYTEGPVARRVYLMHFGEPPDEVELAVAQLKLFNPTGRTEIFVLICQGERP
jgi:hypothetical protein